jgi:chitin disaccharide deacetylase
VEAVMKKNIFLYGVVFIIFVGGFFFFQNKTGNRGIEKLNLKDKNNVVFLTFDDGPIDASLGVLEILSQNQVKATFFINGFHLYGKGDERESKAKKVLNLLLTDGHVIGNHSYNHMLHNCCKDGECGAALCNKTMMWNVKSYQNVKKDYKYFVPVNIEKVREKYSKKAAYPNDQLHKLARMLYSNEWRLSGVSASSPCATSDDVPIWDPAFKCTKLSPTKSAQKCKKIADMLYKAGFAVFGWDIEWSPENYQTADMARTLASGDEFARRVVDILNNGCESEAMKMEQTRMTGSLCEKKIHKKKVVVLTHDFWFEDGKRGNGAKYNLKKLDRFIKVMKKLGCRFETLDRYTEI